VKETDNEKKERGAMMWLSSLLLGVVLLNGLKVASRLEQWLTPLSLLLAAALTIVNLSYLSTATVDACSGTSGATPADVIANKQLSVGVAVLSVANLVLLSVILANQGLKMAGVKTAQRS
jgi:hypothetical protein